jgi:hypothetical protein
VPQGDKSSYSGKQKRQARKIEKGYEKRGASAKTAAKRAWGHGQQADRGRGEEEEHAEKGRHEKDGRQEVDQNHGAQIDRPLQGGEEGGSDPSTPEPLRREQWPRNQATQAIPGARKTFGNSGSWCVKTPRRG